MEEIIYILIIFLLIICIILLLKKINKFKNSINVILKEKREIKKLGGGISEYNRKIQERKERHKIKIIEILKQKGKITNNEIEKALEVSDATVTRYFDELEKEGKILQKGKIKGVYYISV